MVNNEFCLQKGRVVVLTSLWHDSEPVLICS